MYSLHISIFPYVDVLGWYTLNVASANNRTKAFDLSNLYSRAELYDLLFRLSLNHQVEVTSFDYSSTAAPVPANTANGGRASIQQFNKSSDTKLYCVGEELSKENMDVFELSLIEKYEKHVSISKKWANSLQCKELFEVYYFYSM